jgi:hypothetical protein
LGGKQDLHGKARVVTHQPLSSVVCEKILSKDSERGIVVERIAAG